MSETTQTEGAPMQSVAERNRPPSNEQPANAITPVQMLAIAVEQGADLAKLEKLIELQERWERNQARKAFDLAISAAKAEIRPIVKNRQVDFSSNRGRTNYAYEDFAQVAACVDPALSKHGLSYRFRSKQEGKTLTVVCVISHRDGHCEETSLLAPNDESGNKNSIQSIGSAATYLQRYTLKLALGLAAGHDDDAQSHGRSQPTQSHETNVKHEAPQDVYDIHTDAIKSAQSLEELKAVWSVVMADKRLSLEQKNELAILKDARKAELQSSGDPHDATKLFDPPEQNASDLTALKS